MRRLLGRLHRWAGLFIAVFLFLSGISGALIAWDRELDSWLNPSLFKSDSAALSAQRILELANQFETAEPRARIKNLPLATQAGESLTLTVTPTWDAQSNRVHRLPFNQVSLNPDNGTIQATRKWGELSFSREAIMPFLYKLHYTMHIPDGWGIKLGTWFMGIVSIVWLIDCFVALIIAFPHRKAWKKSFAFRLTSGNYKLNFDLHRSGGVWLWGLLLIMALTSIAMNLPEVVRGAVGYVAELTPTRYDGRIRTKRPIAPEITRETILAFAVAEATKRGWKEPAGAIHYNAPYNLYGVSFFSPGNALGAAGLGNSVLYYDGKTGALFSEEVPTAGTAADIFMAAQFPLHSGRIAGMPGRILVSVLGILIAVLSVTGVVIWARKRAARRDHAYKTI
ncbi:PepSY-associated TM helix domain-containing protein [Oxalicibacterium faecigallinarum]|uniref:Peptidase n=1 Tax=Oxalicibacterium faecigallinarum TaxID=573741 RepID=A0A8J3AS92_9BURK|nr:PepSY-associated TM helix domain-containing protein [Oxalicibacterium faecigallinarum]GGI20848.1 peptidase [Oxalicibacterium faecigallinarum]